MKFSKNTYLEKIILALLAWTIMSIILGLVFGIIISILKKYIIIDELIINIGSLLLIAAAFIYLYKYVKKFRLAFSAKKLKYKIWNLIIILIVIFGSIYLIFFNKTIT